MLDQQALQKIVDDSSSTQAERTVAQQQLETLEPKSSITDEEQRAVDFCGPLGLDLLRFAGAHELSEVTWRDLIRFAESREWPGGWENHNVKLLWRGWIVRGSGGVFDDPPYFKERIWNDIKKEFATDEDRRAEFQRIDQAYPLLQLSAIDDPHELQMYERHQNTLDRDAILALTRKRLDEAPEFAFRTREVARRIIAKLTENKDGKR